MMGYARSNSPNAFHHGGKIGTKSRGHFDPKLPCVSRVRDQAGRPNQGLGRNATEIEAVASHEMPLDQCHPSAESRSTGGAHQTTRPCPNHDEVIASRRSWIFPIDGMDVLEEFCVVNVRRLGVGRETRLHLPEVDQELIFDCKALRAKRVM